jgi:subtilisin family serine protease
MRRTMLRLIAPLLPSIALASGLLLSSEQAAQAQGFGGRSMGGGFGGGERSFNPGPFMGRGGGGFGPGLRIPGPDNSIPKRMPRDSFDSGPKGMSRDSGRRGPPMGDFSGKAGRGPKLDRGMATEVPNRTAPKTGGDSRSGRLGKAGDGSSDKRIGRLPKPDRETTGIDPKRWQSDRVGSGNPKAPSGKGDRATTTNNPKNPRTKSDDVGSAGNPKTPWPPRNPDGKPPKGGDDVGSAGGPKTPWPPRNPDGKPPKGGDDVGSAGNPKTPWPPRNPDGKPPKGGDDVGSAGEPKHPWPPRNPDGSPPKGDDVGTTDDPKNPWPPRNPDGNPTPTSDDGRPDGNPPCRRRTGCDDRPDRDPPRWPPRRPPIIVIDPMVPPPIEPEDPYYGDEETEPPYTPPSYTPPNAPTPVYEPSTPSRTPPPRQVDRTPPPAPPAAATPPSAPLPLRRDFMVADQPQYRQNELLVMVQGADPDAVAGQLAQSFNLTIQESQGFTLLQDRRVYRFGIPDNRAVEGLAAAVANAPGVAMTSPNFYHYLQGGNGGDAFGMQYALPKLRVPDTLELVSGRGVTVAVIDSGVDVEHPALKRANIAFIEASDGAIKDPDQHGTAITGIIAGKGDVNGIAPAAQILAIRAFAPERLGGAPVTTSLALARSTDTAVARGAKVVNMSFAGPRDPLLISLIDAAYDRGVVFIAAAGNQGPSAPPAYPAAYEKVIGITATDEDDGLYDMANRGAYVSVAAPGVDILVPVTGQGLDYMSGTSFAAAHISGIAALLIERNPRLGPDDVREILLEAAHDLGKTGRDEEFGAGLADAYGAVTMASPKLQSSINP